MDIIASIHISCPSGPYGLQKCNFEISHERVYMNNFIFQLREKDYITYIVTVVLDSIIRAAQFFLRHLFKDISQLTFNSTLRAKPPFDFFWNEEQKRTQLRMLTSIFEVAAARASRLVNLVFPSTETGF